MLTSVKPTASSIPFDTKRLDGLMEEAGIDVLLATSKHNVQYLLGGHRAFFFDYMDAMGISRYLPLLVYFKGAPEKAGYFGHRLETHQKEVNPFWTPVSNTGSAGSVDVMQKAVEHVRKSGVKARRIPWVMNDVVNERHRVDEWSYVMARAFEAFSPDVICEQPLLKTGDLGAASAPVMLAIAVAERDRRAE